MLRKVVEVLASQPTIEGAGVHLRRAFGYAQVPRFDPFLLLDDFRSSNPDEFLAGFPWHPHRGIETVTYMLEGSVEHGDSLGNSGVIRPGEVQWMTAGRGIVHQEMPKPNEAGRMGGFQLWANLPSSNKMMDPRYRDVLNDQIPIVTTSTGACVRIISGEIDGIRGPVQDIVTEPEYLDVTLLAGSIFEHSVPKDFTVIAYLFEGSSLLDSDLKDAVTSEHLVSFVNGDAVRIRAGDSGARFLLLSGKPIGEPVAWSGPIVMNTDEEIHTAFAEYRDGTFLRRTQ